MARLRTRLERLERLERRRKRRYAVSIWDLICGLPLPEGARLPEDLHPEHRAGRGAAGDAGGGTGVLAGGGGHRP
jgi:hypothetical protein